MREPRSPTQAPTAEPWCRCSSLLATATLVRTPGRRAMRTILMRPSATSRISRREDRLDEAAVGLRERDLRAVGLIRDAGDDGGDQLAGSRHRPAGTLGERQQRVGVVEADEQARPDALADDAFDQRADAAVVPRVDDALLGVADVPPQGLLGGSGGDAPEARLVERDRLALLRGQACPSR